MYEFERTVYHCNTGADGLLKLEPAMAMLMDCCQFQEYQETKFCDWLRSTGTAVFLAAIQIDILRRPAFREKLKIKVVIYDCRSIYGFRRITMRDEAGNLCMISNAVGCFFNFQTGKAVRLPDNIEELLPFDPAEPMEELPRKLALPSGEGELKEPHKVRPSDLDLNQHLNSARYLAIAGDRLPEDFRYDRVRMEFKHQFKCGTLVLPRYYPVEPGRIAVRLDTEEGLPGAVLEFSQR